MLCPESVGPWGNTALDTLLRAKPTGSVLSERFTDEFQKSLGRDNTLSAIIGCLVSHQEEEEEKNANDEVHDKKEETVREGSETTINIVTNRWINVVILLSGRIHPPFSLSLARSLSLSLLKGKTGGSLGTGVCVGANACIIVVRNGVCVV